MRYFITLYFLLAPLAPARAQDWAPVQPNQLYHYATNGGTRLADVARTVAIDSVSATTGTLHLNRIVVQCPWCPGSTVMGNGQATRALRRQPHFMMRHAQHLGGGHWWLFDTASYALHTHAGVGHSWVFDTLNNITATVLGAAPGFVLGVADSIKTLQTSTDGIIQVSKHHGIVRWQLDSLAYQLIGWEDVPSENVLGIRWPRLSEMLNLPTGQILNCHISGSHSDGGCNTSFPFVNQNYSFNSDSLFMGGFAFKNIRMPFVESCDLQRLPYHEINISGPSVCSWHFPGAIGQVVFLHVHFPVIVFNVAGDSIQQIGISNSLHQMPNTIQSSYFADYTNWSSDTVEVIWFGGNSYEPTLYYTNYSPFPISREGTLYMTAFTVELGGILAESDGVDPTAPNLFKMNRLDEGGISLQSQTTRPLHINLQDATGRIIRTATLAPHATAEWGTEILPAGIYIVHATNGHTAQHHRYWVP